MLRACSLPFLLQSHSLATQPLLDGQVVATPPPPRQLLTNLIDLRSVGEFGLLKRCFCFLLGPCLYPSDEVVFGHGFVVEAARDDLRGLAAGEA